MKTPINHCIDILKQNPNEYISKHDTLNLLRVVGVPQEKSVIMQAYSDGLGNGQAYEGEMNPLEVLDELKYYNKTFNHES